MDAVFSLDATINNDQLMDIGNYRFESNQTGEEPTINVMSSSYNLLINTVDLGLESGVSPEDVSNSVDILNSVIEFYNLIKTIIYLIKGDTNE